MWRPSDIFRGRWGLRWIALSGVPAEPRSAGRSVSPEEQRQFEMLPHFAGAVQLRRWDDGAKTPGLLVPDLEHYAERIRAAARAANELKGDGDQ